MVDLDDVAGAAVTVLTAPGHEGAIYELAGPDVLTQVEVAAVLTRRLGREVQAETVSLDAWERRARVSGLTDYGVDTLRAMFHYYERFGFSGNPRALEWLLGRPPTSLDVFLSRIVQSQEE